MEAVLVWKASGFSDNREVAEVRKISEREDFCWLELVKEEPVRSRWEGSQQVGLRGCNGV
jgi:hypothetical protein